MQPHDGGPQAYAHGTATKAEAGYTYVVVSGDTMGGVAERFGLCVSDIAQANEDNLDIFVGQTLRIRRMTTIDLDTPRCAQTSV